MSVSARVRAPVSYREWLKHVRALYGDDKDFAYACEHYNWPGAFDWGFLPEQAVQDCKRWLYG